MSTQDPAVQFYVADIPALQAGSYDLTVTHHAKNLSTQGDQFDESYVFARTIAVRGDRFTLDPAHLGALFPPTAGRGEFGGCLSHVTLLRPTLPWEREIAQDTIGTPWLAVLLFDSETYPAPSIAAVTVADLSHGANGSTLPAATASYGDADPAFGPEYGEALTDPVKVIDVDVETFGRLAPRAADLPWLAHAREVVEANAKADPFDDPGHVALVVGNRTIENDPSGARTYTAHLVSLEGLASFLPSGADEQATALASYSKVRLVSLTSWTFVSVDPAETFAGYFDNVRFTSGPLALASTPPAQVAPMTAADAFAQGYIAADHHTRLGEHTVSWYRGPCVPYATAEADVGAAGAPEGVATGDALLRYDDADTGMFDASYAAAWQLGRLLALRDTAYSHALYGWKRQAADASAMAAVHHAVAGALEVDVHADLQRIVANLIVALYDPATLGAHPR
jgi:hypothetical protein